MKKLAANAPQGEPGGFSSALLALLVHALFFAFLFFAVSWRTDPPQGMVAELWTALPAATPQPAAPPPPPRPVVKPEPPKPEPKPPPKPVEEPKPQPKPDIALKEKAEQEKKKREEERKRAEDERKKEAEKRRLEQEKAAEAEKARREQVAQLAREQEALNQRLEAQTLAAAAQSRLVDDYRGRIVAKIKRLIVMPPEIPGNPEAVFDVVLLPSGEVLSAKLKKSSGHAAYDAAVERAILKAQPLPLPPDPSAFASFRNLVLVFRPLE